LEIVITLSFLPEREALRNVMIKPEFFHIFYCHPAGFCAIKGNLQPQMERGFVNKSQLPYAGEKNNLKGGMGVGVPIFPNFRRVDRD
jgi:hypothetical protein